MPRARGFDSGFAPGFGVGPYWYVLGPWVWDTSGPFGFWRAPDLTVGTVDLRTIAQQSVPGGTPQGQGFFVTAKDPGSAYTVIGRAIHFGEEQATVAHRDAWEAATGFRPDGALLSDLLFEHLTTFADPDGQAACRPLMTTVAGNLDLHVGGHSLVRRDRFTQAHPHWNKVRNCLRRQFRQHFEASQSRGFRTRHGIDREHHRRILDYWCQKYRVADWREFVPTDLRAHVPGRLRHETTISDNMVRADGTTIGNQLSWTEVGGDFFTGSNAIFKNNNSGVESDYARADSDLSSDDHYAEWEFIVGVNSMGIGPACRLPGTTDADFYTLVTQFGGNLYLKKLVAGTPTYMVTTPRLGSAGDIFRCETDGSTITGYVDAVSELSTTDTAITGNVRCGASAYDASGLGGVITNFEAADLAAGNITLSAEAASFSFTGSAASLEQGYEVAAGSGSYTFTGQTASLEQGLVLTAAGASYLWTPSAASLFHDYLLTATGTTYSWTGQDATLIREGSGAFWIDADIATFSFTGQAAGLEHNRILTAQPVSYDWAPSAASLEQGYVLKADPASYSWTGQTLTFSRDRVIIASSGVYVWTPTAAELTITGLVFTSVCGDFKVMDEIDGAFFCADEIVGQFTTKDCC